MALDKSTEKEKGLKRVTYDEGSKCWDDGLLMLA